MKRITLLYAALLTCSVFSCGPSIRVYSDYDKEININDYKAYNWLEEEAIEAKGLNPLYYNELNDKRIKQAVDKQMVANGFIHEDTAVLQLHYHLVVEDKTITLKEPHRYPALDGPVNEKSIFPYRQGTIIIDLMDKKKKALVWRGVATGAIEEDVKKDPEAAIDKAVKKIFTKFPYSHK